MGSGTAEGERGECADEKKKKRVAHLLPPPPFPFCSRSHLLQASRAPRPPCPTSSPCCSPRSPRTRPPARTAGRGRWCEERESAWGVVFAKRPGCVYKKTKTAASRLLVGGRARAPALHFFYSSLSLSLSLSPAGGVPAVVHDFSSVVVPLSLPHHAVPFHFRASTASTRAAAAVSAPPSTTPLAVAFTSSPVAPCSSARTLRSLAAAADRE